MNRLIRIEWFKIRSFKAFWIFLGIYALCISSVVLGIQSFLRFIKNQGGDFNGLDPTMLPIFDMADVWQNMAYLSSIFKIMLGFIVVTTIANEVRNRTLRQSIIDGQSPTEYLKGKLLWNAAMALFSSLVVFLVSLIAGLLYSKVQGVDYILNGLQFVGGHFLVIFLFMCFCMMITLMLPRPGIVIIGIFAYTIIFEPIAYLICTQAPGVPDWARIGAEFLPISAISSVVNNPFPKYILQEIQDYVSLSSVGIAFVWGFIFVGVSYLLLHKKDW